jgi:hypothetical protein
MALQGWDKNYREELKIQQEVIESLQQQLMISGKGGSPGQPYDDPEKDKGPFVPAPPRDKLLAGGPQLPDFKPMGRVIKGTREGVRTFDENKITRPLQIGPQAMDYPPPSELDKWLQLYQRNGGSLRHLDPDMRRLILQRGAMKAEAANNIRSLQSTGHQTVLDDNRPGHLKIIKQFKPPRA